MTSCLWNPRCLLCSGSPIWLSLQPCLHQTLELDSCVLHPRLETHWGPVLLPDLGPLLPTTCLCWPCLLDSTCGNDRPMHKLPRAPSPCPLMVNLTACCLCPCAKGFVCVLVSNPHSSPFDRGGDWLLKRLICPSKWKNQVGRLDLCHSKFHILKHHFGLNKNKGNFLWEPNMGSSGLGGRGVSKTQNQSWRIKQGQWVGTRDSFNPLKLWLHLWVSEPII